MGNSPLFLLILICLFCANYAAAQSTFDVSEPRFELKDNIVLIHFDILNSTPSDNFDISIDITDADGNRINARALNGDIGKNVPGGNNKVITWDLESDGIVMNAEIIVNIYAKIILPPSSPPVATERDRKATDEFNRAGLIIQSIALPGLGLSRYTGKPHWIRGVAGYGCIAGSIVLNKMAVSSYDDFLAAETTEDSDAFMTEATQQDNISEVMAYAAIGIWVTDLLWTMIGTRDLNKKSLYSETKGITFKTGYDPVSSSPMVGINLRF